MHKKACCKRPFLVIIILWYNRLQVNKILSASLQIQQLYKMETFTFVQNAGKAGPALPNPLGLQFTAQKQFPNYHRSGTLGTPHWVIGQEGKPGHTYVHPEHVPLYRLQQQLLIPG